MFAIALAGNAIAANPGREAKPADASGQAELLAEHFHRPAAEIKALHEKGLSYPEIAKILVIAQMSKISVPDLLKRNSKGRGWGTISKELGLNAVEVKRNLEKARRAINQRRRQASRADSVAAYFHRPASDIHDLRNQGAGYGEIVKILVIAEMSRLPIPELLDKNRQGYGWGAISRQAGLDATQVVKKVEKARRDLGIKTTTAAGPKKK